MKERLKNIILEEKKEYNFVESVTLGSIVIPYIKMNKYDVYIWGGGSDIESVVLFFEKNSITVQGIIDSDRNKGKRKVFHRIPYIHPDEIKNNIENTNVVYVIINTKYFQGLDESRIVDCLYKNGIDKFYALDKSDIIHIKPITVFHPMAANRIGYYRDHIDDLLWAYELLYDDYSRDVMTEYVRVFMQEGIFSLEQIDGRKKYFFGRYERENDKYENLYTHLDDEVWINCGANIGDNVFLYFDNGLKAKRIYAFEGDSSTYEILTRNIAMLIPRYRDKVITINEYISEETGFEKYINEKVTFLNADIEGAELDMLYAVRNILIKDRPVLAICVYHKAEDLVEIPKYLFNILDDYVYYLRKYPADNVSTKNWSEELVLYAVPKERMYQ